MGKTGRDPSSFIPGTHCSWCSTCFTTGSPESQDTDILPSKAVPSGPEEAAQLALRVCPSAQSSFLSFFFWLLHFSETTPKLMMKNTLQVDLNIRENFHYPGKGMQMVFIKTCSWGFTEELIKLKELQWLLTWCLHLMIPGSPAFPCATAMLAAPAAGQNLHSSSLLSLHS